MSGLVSKWGHWSNEAKQQRFCIILHPRFWRCHISSVDGQSNASMKGCPEDEQHQATLGHLWCSSSEQDLYYPWTWPIQPIRPNSSTYCFPFEEGKSHDLIMTKWWIVFPSWIPRSAVQELWLCGADLRGCSLCSSTAAVGSWLHCGRASDGPDFGQTLETGGLECQGAEQRGCRAAELQGSNLGVWLCQSSLQVDLGCFKTRSSI